VLEYMAARNLNVDDTDYYWSPSLGYRDRLIIPFYFEGRVVGWTGRSVLPNKKPKYLTEVQPGFVYGLDEQRHTKVFAVVCEGQIDAIHVEGCALGGSEISDQQAMLLNRLQKQIIVVPDRDKAGSKLVERAIELGWSVSFTFSFRCVILKDNIKQRTHARLYIQRTKHNYSRRTTAD
jgi:DNA primase